MKLQWYGIVFSTLVMSTSVIANPIVEIKKSGVKYRGITNGSIEEFQQIKFGHDTSGSRRFAPPEPYKPPEGSDIDATTPGPACPQIRRAIPPFFGETLYQSEDCLHLRITRPAGTTVRDKLPVVVHLVGGGVVKASAYEEHFDPVNLINHSASINKPIIHVVLNYRVTIFGFARLGILKDHRSLNVGMRDQRAGYQWVKENIAAFGGNPDRITSFGLSSGGTFSSLHLMTYAGEQGVPFTQAWAMSGPPGTALNLTSDATEIHTRAVAEKLGCGQSNEDEAILSCLRGIPMDDLTETAMGYSISNHPPAGLFTFIPSIDGDFLPERQSVLFKSGRFVKGIPMVFGWTQDDGATNTGSAPMFQSEADIKIPIKNFAHALTEQDYEQLFFLYSESDFEEDVHNYEARKTESDPAISVHYFRAARIMRDILFTCSSIEFGSEITRQSRALDPAFPGVRLYNLNQSMVTPLFHAAGMPWLGAVHGSDIDYIYNNMFPRETRSEHDKLLSDNLLASFISFVYSGDPNGDNAKVWPESFSDFKDLNASKIEITHLSQVGVQLFGGPWGTQNFNLDSRMDGVSDLGVEEGNRQNPLLESLNFGEMESANRQEGQRLLERERLLERCALINSFAEKLGH